MMGMEHERIHIETSSCIFAQMPLELMKPQASWPLCQETRPLADVPRNKLVAESAWGALTVTFQAS